MRRIARVLEIAPSAVSRELRRNRSGFGYMSGIADDRAKAGRARASRRPLKFTLEVQSYVIGKLKLGHSPEQNKARVLRLAVESAVKSHFI